MTAQQPHSDGLLPTQPHETGPPARMTTNDALPIIDAHHHFWDPVRNSHPWLSDLPMIPFRYGDYSAIRQPFLPADYQRLWSHHNIVASVTRLIISTRST